MENKIYALVDFDNGIINVGIESEGNASNIHHGEILLLTSTIFRFISLVGDFDLKMGYMTSIVVGNKGLSMQLDRLINNWNTMMVQNVQELGTSPDGTSKRGFTAELDFAEGFHFAKIKPRGFGVLGKGIDIGSLIAVSVLHQYLINKYSQDAVYVKKVDEALKMCGKKAALEQGKLSVGKARFYSEEIAEMLFPYVA